VPKIAPIRKPPFIIISVGAIETLLNSPFDQICAKPKQSATLSPDELEFENLKT
jgi:hypothetical protein